jgi:hypothetical protein
VEGIIITRRVIVVLVDDDVAVTALSYLLSRYQLHTASSAAGRAAIGFLLLYHSFTTSYLPKNGNCLPRQESISPGEDVSPSFHSPYPVNLLGSYSMVALKPSWLYPLEYAVRYISLLTCQSGTMREFASAEKESSSTYQSASAMYSCKVSLPRPARTSLSPRAEQSVGFPRSVRP